MLRSETNMDVNIYKQFDSCSRWLGRLAKAVFLRSNRNMSDALSRLFSFGIRLIVFDDYAVGISEDWLIQIRSLLQERIWEKALQ